MPASSIGSAIWWPQRAGVVHALFVGIGKALGVGDVDRVFLRPIATRERDQGSGGHDGLRGQASIVAPQAATRLGIQSASVFGSHVLIDQVRARHAYGMGGHAIVEGGRGIAARRCVRIGGRNGFFNGLLGGRRRGSWRRVRVGLSGALVLLLGIGMVAGCSIEKNYKTLSFFFDGVPDPNAPPPEEIAPAADPIDYANLTSEERSRLLGRRVEAPTVYHHKPVQERRCNQCHGIDGRPDPLGFRGGLPTLIAPKGELCIRCHASPAGSFVHGPAGSGRCDECHLPHQSFFPHLLKVEHPKALCTACHSGDVFPSAGRHDAAGFERCTDCHDPHASERPALLREGASWSGPPPDRDG